MLLNGLLGSTARSLDVRHPVDDRVVGCVARDTAADVGHALEALANGADCWSAQERSELLRTASQQLLARRDKFAQLITAEAGTCIRESLREVDRASHTLLVASEEALRLHGEALRIQSAGKSKLAITLYESVGVVCAITPFNRPLNQVVVKVAPALAAGARIVVKPSELTPLSCIAFVELLLSVGLPKSVIAVVTGQPEEIGPALLSSSLVDMVTFTGSVTTGELVARQAGVKKLLLELGGNDPLIVLADADLDRAAELVIAGAFGTAGQSCRGIKRVIALEAIADGLTERIASRARRLKVGDPFDPATEVGSMIHSGAAARVEQRCRRAVSEGAKLICGGERRGSMMTPCVLDYVSPSSELVCEETFGPVAPVLRVADLDAALSLANATRFGLQAGVVTNDLSAFLHLASKLRVGAVNLGEGPQFESPHIPFGGVKKSGLGREGVRWAIREMSTIKTVVLPWEAT